MGIGRRLWRRLLAGAIAVVIATAAARGQATVRRLAERGPPTLVVGGVFTPMSPPIMVVTGLRCRSLRLPACELGRGGAMLAAGAVRLPAVRGPAPLRRGALS